MSTANSFDKNQHLAELNSPLFGVNPTPMSPAVRKAAARINLGVQSSAEVAAASKGFPNLKTRTSNAVNATATMTTANIMAGLITSTTAAGVNATLPLAATLETDLTANQAPNALAVGDSFEIVINNTGANSFTIVTNTGWTVTNLANLVVATGTNAVFMVRRTGANAYQLIRTSTAANA